MKRAISLLTCLILCCGPALAGVGVDEDAFGKSLGGWRKKSQNTAEYSLSGSVYRTYRPETSKTPEGGIFVSIRIDHVRGWLSSDDHAILEITIGPKGTIDSAKSNIAIQGKSITSDVIVGVSEAGQAVTQMDQAVQVGTDLVANLTAKLLREKIVEAGRVSFPAALRHNYNLLYQALRVDGVPVAGDASTPDSASTQPGPVANQTPASTSPASPQPQKSPETAATPVTDADNPAKEESAPVAIPVPEHKELEVTPYAAPAPDTRTGS